MTKGWETKMTRYELQCQLIQAIDRHEWKLADKLQSLLDQMKGDSA